MMDTQDRTYVWEYSQEYHPDSCTWVNKALSNSSTYYAGGLELTESFLLYSRGSNKDPHQEHRGLLPPHVGHAICVV
jgi:hypothetical protein